MERSVTPIKSANSEILIKIFSRINAKIFPDVFPDTFPDVFTNTSVMASSKAYSTTNLDGTVVGCAPKTAFNKRLY